MIVRTKEELEEVKKLIPKEFLENPEFESQWDWAVKYEFEKKIPINITVSDEKKTISVIPKVEVNRNLPVPTGTLNAYEFHISARGEMEVTRSLGEMYDAKAYYRETGKKPTTATSIFKVCYRKTVYDSDGIERAIGVVNIGYYPFKSFYGYDFEYDLVHRLPYELVTEKGQIPANWDVYASPVLPQTVYGTVYVEGTVRKDDNPMIARIYSFEFESGRLTKQEDSLGFLYREHPEILKIIPDDVFAKLNYSNRQYELYENFAGRWEGRSLEELARDKSLENEQMLETRKDNAKNKQDAHQLEVLYQQVVTYNQRYKQELEQSSSRHM